MPSRRRRRNRTRARHEFSRHCRTCHTQRDPTDIDDFEGPAPAAEHATDALPGTAEKIAVLTERVAQNRELWHPEDAAYSWRRDEP